VDEVPTAVATRRGERNPRQLLLAGLAALAKRWTSKGNRLLVTSRPHGLADADVARLGLRVAPIADMPAPLQNVLVRRWFRIQKQDRDKGDASAADLLRDLSERDWLRPLAANPLMLTAMCAIYSDGGRLPQDRHQLYDRIVDGVLVKRYAEIKRRTRVRFELGVIACAMHTGDALGAEHPEPLAQATFIEAELALKTDSPASSQRDSVLRPKDARHDLLAHSGLLTDRGPQQLGFYHLSIQEFLAAERIFERQLGDLAAVFLARAAVPAWRNTLSFLFGRYLAAFSVATRPLTLLGALVEQLSEQTFGLQVVVADCTEMLRARGDLLEPPAMVRLSSLLLGSMMRRESAKDRCEAGTSLGRLGDPRFDPEHWFLPLSDEAPLGFLRVAEGPFTMGSDPARDPQASERELPAHDVVLQDFFIARYPVTVAQYGAFVRETGHRTDPDSLLGVGNHPAIWVSWHEALAYCRWLTSELRGWKDAPRAIDAWLEGTIRNGWEVTLPTEAEWEKAARGQDRRIYAWGDHFDPDAANCADTAIGRTSPVGAFPRGASPCGALDMSGNVWEWTRSLWGADWNKPERAYPYQAADWHSDDLKAPDEVRRMVRGGSFSDLRRLIRSAYRGGGDTAARGGLLGFRLAVVQGQRR
jgi:formylglycine-generating enzyme required for sulfatase activity